MNETTMHWIEACTVHEIPVRGAVRLEYGDKKIAVFKSSMHEVLALEDSCPHKGGPLSDGIVHGDCVTCPLHSWDINLKTGDAIGNDEGHVDTYKVRVVNDLVYVEISEIELIVR